MANDTWSIVLIAGMFGWITSTLVFIFKAFPVSGRFETRPARIWGGLVAVSFAVWIIGLLNA